MDDLIQGEKKGELMGYFPNGTEDVRVVTVQLREFDHSEEYERDGQKGWRAIYKTVPVKVCGGCVDRCGDACKTQDRTFGECGCPHCDECDCGQCSTYIGDEEHNARRHRLEQERGIDLFCPACHRGQTIPPDVEMRQAGAPQLF